MIVDLALRLVISFLFHGMALALSHSVTGYSGLSHVRRRPLEWAQGVMIFLAVAGLAVEVVQYLRSGQPRPFLVAPFALGSGAWLTWSASFMTLLLAAGYFVLVPLSEYRSLVRSVSSLTADQLTSETDLLDLHESVRRLTRQYSLLGYMERGRLHACIDRIVPRGEIPLPLRRRWALSQLRAGRLADSLRLLLAADGVSLDTLLLATECREWMEIVRMTGTDARATLPRGLIIESIQMMGYCGNEGVVSKALPLLRGFDGNARRVAGIVYRQGRREQAAALLAHDLEARGWVRSSRIGESHA